MKIEVGLLDAPHREARGRNGCGGIPSKTMEKECRPPLKKGVRVGGRCAGSYRVRSYPDRARESSPGEVGLNNPARSGWRPERAASLGQHISGAHGRRSSSFAGVSTSGL